MRARYVVCALACAATAALGAAPAQAAKRPRENSFMGNCHIAGIVNLGQPLQNTTDQIPNTYEYQDASGTCNGTLNDKPVIQAPVTVTGSGPCIGNCYESRTTDPGHATVTFPNGPGKKDDATFDLTLNFVVVVTETQMQITGSKSGVGSAHGTFLAQNNFIDMANACNAGTLQRAPFDIWLESETPFVTTSKH